MSRIKEYRPFFIILLITAAVWWGASMTDVHSYDVEVPVELTDIDTIRYAVMERDTALLLQLQQSGFAALGRTLNRRQVKPIAVSMAGTSGFYRAVAVNAQMEHIMAQLQFKGVVDALPLQDSLTLLLSERKSKTYVPKLANVEFAFAAGVGLHGVPQIVPEQVTLYGSEASLAQIAELQVAPASIANIQSSQTFTLPIEPVWERYPDVRASVTEVQVQVPVASYTEKTLRVPIRLHDTVGASNIRLYPAQVEVTFWVTPKDLTRLEASNVVAEAVFDPAKDQLPVALKQFPSFARVKQINPSEVHYVVIQ